MTAKEFILENYPVTAKHFENKECSGLNDVAYICEKYHESDRGKKISLSDKEIEDHIWEYFPRGLTARDKENNTYAYELYLKIVELVKDMRNI